MGPGMSHAVRNGGGPGDVDPLRLFLSLRAELLRYGRSIASDGEDVEDIVQEAWLRFDAATSTKRVPESRGFLFRIVHNLVMDRYRRRRVERTLLVGDGAADTDVVPSDEPTAEVRLESANELAAVRAAIARLPERTRQAFLLHRVHGLKLVDVAARLGISKSLAQQLVVDGLEACREARRRAG